MTANHIRRWADGAQTHPESYPICGQANSHSAVVLAPDEPLPEGRHAPTCKRCIRRHMERADR